MALNENSAVAILGSTGSIGRQALDVAGRLGLRVAAIAAGSSVGAVEAQARRFLPEVAVLYDEGAARELKIRLADTPVRVYGGAEGVEAAARMGNIALNGIVGIRGLAPTLAAIDAGHTVALANKETLVCAGTIVNRRAREKGVRILPVDSEHSAVFQCLQGNERALRRVILTCSGGAFYGKTRAETYRMTRREALAHPNWRMGEKITVDCATLMNKGLECIEAMRLFGVGISAVEVLIHRESIVHSLIELADGAVLGQLGVPDMRLPIQYALTYPERMPCPAETLRLAGRRLTFAEPDTDAFPCLKLARDAAARSDAACAVLNGANEQAVARFLRGEIVFGQIADTVAYALETVPERALADAGDVYEVDREARAAADVFINR